MNNPYIFGILALAVFAVGTFQLLVLAQCGVVHRRLGIRTDDVKTTEGADLSLVGRLVGPQPKRMALVASLACTSCQHILRWLNENKTYAVPVFLIDKSSSGQIDNARVRFPDMSQLNLIPGYGHFKDATIAALPIHIAIDENGHISKQTQINTINDLESALKNEIH